jgi:hypothetical protein
VQERTTPGPGDDASHSRKCRRPEGTASASEASLPDSVAGSP